MKLTEIKLEVSNAEGKITSTGLGKLLAAQATVLVSAAKTTAKILYFAAGMISPTKSLKKYAEEIAGCPLGSAIENGYKAHVVLRRLLAVDEKADEKVTITEDCFDSLGIDALIQSSVIINAVDGHDSEIAAIEKLVAILKSHKAAGEMLKAIAELKKEVKNPTQKVEKTVKKDGENAATESDSEKNLRAQNEAQHMIIGALSFIAGNLLANRENDDVINDPDVAKALAVLSVTGNAPEVVPDWLANLRDIMNPNRETIKVEAAA